MLDQPGQLMKPSDEKRQDKKEEKRKGEETEKASRNYLVWLLVTPKNM